MFTVQQGGDRDRDDDRDRDRDHEHNCAPLSLSLGYKRQPEGALLMEWTPRCFVRWNPTLGRTSPYTSKPPSARAVQALLEPITLLK
jgi:hypothetical protein